LTTNFLNPFRGGKLRATARRTGGGNSVFLAEGRILDAEGKLVATATGAFRVIKKGPSS
jgi:acyl-coenzyme A thioesterase PaaI-like protein